MKVTIPKDLKGKELTSFIIQNKEALYAQKNKAFKYADAWEAPVELFHVKGASVTKSADVPKDADTLRVKVVANTANWCDSHMDVLLPDCWAKSINERKGMIPHLHDHIHQLNAEVGDVVNIYSQIVSLSELGVNKPGTTQSLIFETDIKKAYNQQVFDKYKAGKVKQHSIGLQYVKLELAINDEESEKEKDFWDKYIDQVINREYVEERGFFWVVPEIKLIENSAVLFGSNSLTPTLESKEDDTENEPPQSTHVQQKKSIFSGIGSKIKS
jgi:hypothetical protein